ncbi:MAG: peptidylprolyl isomerase [Thermoprotei archaeon]|nr:MAG: peptidylprolyl isomerase [Thermoprotei archaeon]RLE96988.1 MAG: peptidylprolyl isomerase [Thermoprotei archaeon]
MSLNDGDYILVDYTVKVKEDDRIIDTTNEKEAREANIFDENKVYGPELVIIGEGWLLKSVEEELKKMSVGEEKILEIPPERAFGKRDPSKVRTVSIRDLLRKNIRPKVNEIISFDGKIATVKRIGSGRVVLDFNHPLAGKTLIYRIKVIKKIESTDKKIKELLRRRLRGVDLSKIKIIIENRKASLILPQNLLSISNINLALKGLIADIKRYLSEITEFKIIFEAIFERKEEETSESSLEPA